MGHGRRTLSRHWWMLAASLWAEALLMLPSAWATQPDASSSQQESPPRFGKFLVESVFSRADAEALAPNLKKFVVVLSDWTQSDEDQTVSWEIDGSQVRRKIERTGSDGYAQPATFEPVANPPINSQRPIVDSHPFQQGVRWEIEWRGKRYKVGEDEFELPVYAYIYFDVLARPLEGPFDNRNWYMKLYPPLAAKQGQFDELYGIDYVSQLDEAAGGRWHTFSALAVRGPYRILVHTIHPEDGLADLEWRIMGQISRRLPHIQFVDEPPRSAVERRQDEIRVLEMSRHRIQRNLELRRSPKHRELLRTEEDLRTNAILTQYDEEELRKIDALLRDRGGSMVASSGSALGAQAGDSP